MEAKVVGILDNNITFKPSSYYNGQEFGNILGRKSLLLWIREFLTKSDVNGYYIEFGVFNGESIKEAFYCLRGSVSKYIGLDSFEGLPANSADDDVTDPNFYEKNYCSAGVDFVRTNILSTGLDANNLTLVPGFFENTLTKNLELNLLQQGKAAVIHMDVDLY